MIDTHSLDRLSGATIYDRAGDKIGKLGTVYLDNHTGEPTFATVSTGLFGTSESFVPLQGAQMDGEDLRVEYTKDQVKDAPRVDAGGELAPAEEARLYEHYQLDTGDARAEGTGGTGTADGDRGGRDTGVAGQPGPASGHDGGRDSGGTETVTAHEERLDVGTRAEETGRARLRKYTTTDTETVEVPVAKEKLVVEREDAGGTVRKGGLEEVSDTDRDEEITLREERPVVDKETVERERVQVGKEKVTDTETVTEEVRTEHVDVEGEDHTGR